jgi:hypothetical protein
MSLKITADHVRELATLHGKNVLVEEPCAHPPAGGLWVIEVGNKHYEGSDTVYATSEQVDELVEDADFDEDGDLKPEAAERIAQELNSRPTSDARASAYTMPHSDGFTARVMREMHTDD